MPVIKKRLTASEHPDHDRLVAELVRHLKGGAGLPSFPKIVEEEIRLSNGIRVYVSWNDWASVPEAERSEIILEAYKRARGMPGMLKISVAMGLTPLEARQLGLNFESEEPNVELMDLIDFLKGKALEFASAPRITKSVLDAYGKAVKDFPGVYGAPSHHRDGIEALKQHYRPAA